MLKTVIRSAKKVLPSGVPVQFNELDANDMANFLEDSKKGDKDSLIKYVYASLVSVGNLSGKELTLKFVKSMLTEDFKFMLFEVRMFSFNSDFFDCSVYFPSEMGEQIREEKSIPLKSLSKRPYIWVSEHKDYDSESKTFPIMYKSYKDMIAEQKERTWKMKLNKEMAEVNGFDAVDVIWNLPSANDDGGDDEKDFNKAYNARNPVFKTIDTIAGKEIPATKELDFGAKGMPLSLGDAFRSEFQRVEAKIDTVVTVEYSKNRSITQTFDLMTTKEFLSPSLATS